MQARGIQSSYFAGARVQPKRLDARFLKLELSHDVTHREP
jgi:hypothetical protein